MGDSKGTWNSVQRWRHLALPAGLFVLLLLLLGGARTALTGAQDSTHTAQRSWVLATVVAVILAILVAWLVSHKSLQKKASITPTLWILSISTSLVLALGIAAIWVIVSALPVAPAGGSLLLSPSDVTRSVQDYAVASQSAPLAVPTGVFLQSLEFSPTDANNVMVTGTVWQRYAHDLPAGIERGFRLPDATAVTINEEYSADDGDAQVIGWSFQGMVHEAFTYGTYPLDQQDIRVLFRPAEFTRNVVLTPDLASYTVASPGARPGLSPNLVLDGWDAVQSYFTYDADPVNTTFGLANHVNQTRYPALYFNVRIKRVLAGPMVDYLFTALIAAVMLFFVLMVTTRELERRYQAGWNVVNVFTYCAALLFVILIAHINMRTAVGGETVLYLGYFYFALYALVVLVMLNAALLTWRDDWKWIAFADNLIPKALYWPLYWAALFLLTVVRFV